MLLVLEEGLTEDLLVEKPSPASKPEVEAAGGVGVATVRALKVVVGLIVVVVIVSLPDMLNSVCRLRIAKPNKPTTTTDAHTSQTNRRVRPPRFGASRERLGSVVIFLEDLEDGSNSSAVITFVFTPN